MTILEHLKSADTEPERAAVTFPPQGLPTVPGTSMIPWWTGVPLLDPDLRNYGDLTYAAGCAAIACGVHVFGLNAGYADWSRRQMKSPVRKWAEWLIDAGEVQVPKRTLTLRLVCERAAAFDPDNILQVAKDLCDAGTLR
jgi:hypothetical protein